MLRLLAISLSLFALGSAQGPPGWVQLGDHPLLTTVIRYFNQTLPCAGPCVLDSIDYIVGEVMRGENSATGQCVNRFVQSVQGSFPPVPPGADQFQYFTMQWLDALSRPNVICPKLDPIVSCFASASENVCGRSSRVENERLFRSLLTFLDCGIPVDRHLRVLECLVPVAAIFSPVPPPGFNTFQQCTAPAINYFNQGYDTVYRDISGSNFNIFERHVRSLVQCYLDWNPSLTTGRCNNSVNHVYKQLNSIMDWLRDGDGRSMFTCLGDLTLYANAFQQPGPFSPTFESCINTFMTNGGDLIRRVSEEISNGYVGNVRNFLRELATDTCRTRAVPSLIECMERVLVSRPSRRCSEVVLPTFRHAYMPTLQYVYLLGGCSSRIRGGALLSGVCQCQRAIPDYSFRPEVSSQCEMDRTRSYTITFAITDYRYTPYDFSGLQADLQPKIEAVYGGIYGGQFITSENYRFRLNGECLEVTVDLVFDESVNTNPENLVSSLPGNIVGNGGYLYEVMRTCTPPTRAPAALSLDMVVIIVVVGVVGVLLVIVLLVCCCCYDSGWCCRGMQHRRPEKTVIHVPATNYMYPAVNPGLCVQQAPVLSPYGHCSCQPPPTKTILQIQ